MRKVLPGDIDLAARALTRVSDPQRVPLAERLVAEARAADKYTRRLHKPHPLWGDGSLGAAARARPLAPRPSARALQTIRDVLAAHR